MVAMVCRFKLRNRGRRTNTDSVASYIYSSISYEKTAEFIPFLSEV
jgi:hypothetical protein